MLDRNKTLSDNLLPKRNKAIELEDKSYRIFEKHAPDNWIIRDLTKRDYGIDLIIEIIEHSQVSGRLFTCQLKSIQSMNNNLTCYNIKPSSFNYWALLPTSTFLFFVDINNEKIYFSNIKEYIRRYYNDFKNNTLNKIKFDNKSDITRLKSIEKNDLIIKTYDYEEKIKYYENQMLFFLFNLGNKLDLFQEHLCRDRFMALNDFNNDDYEFFLVYKNYLELSDFFGINWPLKTLNEYYNEGLIHYPEHLTGILFEEQASIMSKLFIVQARHILTSIISFINDYENYWNNTYNFEMSLITRNLDLIIKKQEELELVIKNL